MVNAQVCSNIFDNCKALYKRGTLLLLLIIGHARIMMASPGQSPQSGWFRIFLMMALKEKHI